MMIQFVCFLIPGILCRTAILGGRIMKRVFAFVLMLTLVCSVGAVAFAGYSSPNKTVGSTGSGMGTAALPAADFVLEVCNKEDEVIDRVPKQKVVYATIGQAGLLPKADKEAFQSEYKDVRQIKDQVVKYFFWLNTKNYEEPADFAYYKYNFRCTGENVQVTVNGKDMAVVNVEGSKYFAKLTELGSVAILCDK